MAGAEDPELYAIFCSFAAFGAGKGAVAELDGAKFVKFARDCGVIDKSLTSTQVDLVFAKVKEKTERKIGFDQFLRGLGLLAAIKFPGDAGAYAELRGGILASAGPKVASSVAVDTSGVYSKLTDTSLYTGAHKERFDESGAGRGLEGRDSVATGGGSGGSAHHGGAVADLSEVTRAGTRGGTTLSSASAAKAAAPKLDRGAAAAATAAAATGAPRRASGSEDAAPGSGRSSDAAHAPAPAASRSPATGGGGARRLSGGGAGGGGGGASAGGGDLHSIFVAYACFGGTSSVVELDNAKFAKLCRESGIIDKRVTPASVDISFSRVKDKAKRLITYDQFLVALAALGKEKYPTMEPEAAKQAIYDLVVAAGGPTASGTRADTGGIYDKLTDTSLYTGAHKERFDDSGAGRGLAGRDSVATGGGPGKYHGGAVADLSQITRT